MDKTAGGATQVPYPEYAPEVERLLHAVYERKIVIESFDWGAWTEAEQFRDPGSALHRSKKFAGSSHFTFGWIGSAKAILAR